MSNPNTATARNAYVKMLLDRMVIPFNVGDVVEIAVLHSEGLDDNEDSFVELETHIIGRAELTENCTWQYSTNLSAWHNHANSLEACRYGRKPQQLGFGLVG